MPTEQATSVDVQFRACAGKKQGTGRTPAEALDDLLGQLGDAVPTPIVIRSFNRGDQFFTDAQQRLLDLRSRMEELTSAEREERQQLVEVSFRAAVARIRWERILMRHYP